MKKTLVFLLFFAVLISAGFYIYSIKFKCRNNETFLLNQDGRYFFDILSDISKNKIKNYRLPITNFNVKHYKDFIHYNEITEDISEAEIYYSLGNFYFLKNSFNKSVFFYKKALMLAPNNIEIKYNVKNIIDFINSINTPQKLIEYNSKESLEHLAEFIADKETGLKYETENIKRELKDFSLKSLNCVKEIKFLNLKNRDNIYKEIQLLTKERESSLRQKDTLEDKINKQENLKNKNLEKELEKQKENVRLQYRALQTQEKSILNKLQQNPEYLQQKKLQQQLDDIQSEMSELQKYYNQIQIQIDYLQQKLKRNYNSGSEIVNFVRHIYENVSDIDNENIYSLENKKKLLRKKLKDEINESKENFDFFENLDLKIIQRVMEPKEYFGRNIAEEYFDKEKPFSYEYKKEMLFKDLMERFETETGNKNGQYSGIENYINTANLKKQKFIEESFLRQMKILNEIIKTDKLMARMSYERMQQLLEEKDNIGFILKDINFKQKEIFIALNGNSNSQKKKNLQKELTKMQEKEKALKQELADCNKDIKELETIRENMSVYNEINMFDVKIAFCGKYIKISDDIKNICEYIKTFCSAQEDTLYKLNNALKNDKVSYNENLKDCAEKIKDYDRKSRIMTDIQNRYAEQKKLLSVKYTEQINSLKETIENVKKVENENIFDKQNIFLNKELKYFEEYKADLSDGYEKIFDEYKNLSSCDKIIMEKLKVFEKNSKELDGLKSFSLKKEKSKQDSLDEKQVENMRISRQYGYINNIYKLRQEMFELNNRKSQNNKKQKNKKK